MAERPPKPLRLPTVETTPAATENRKAPWLKPFHWKPGESGNPGGRPKSTAALKELAQSHTDEAFSLVAKLMKADNLIVDAALATMSDPRATPAEKLEAIGLLKSIKKDNAVEVLERGHGKSQQKVEISHENPFEGLTEDEIRDVVAEQSARLSAKYAARAQKEIENGKRKSPANPDAPRKAQSGGVAGGSRT